MCVFKSRPITVSPTADISLPLVGTSHAPFYIRTIFSLTLRVPVLATPDTPSRIRRYLKNVNPTASSFPSASTSAFFLLPLLPPLGSWTGRLQSLTIRQGSHDVAEQLLPSPRRLISPNPPLFPDRQAPPCPRSDIYIPISRPRINTMGLLIPRLTPLLHSNTPRNPVPVDISRPNPLTTIRLARSYRRSKNRIQTSTPLPQRRGANGRHSVALVSKISQPLLWNRRLTAINHVVCAMHYRYPSQFVPCHASKPGIN